MMKAEELLQSTISKVVMSVFHHTIAKDDKMKQCEAEIRSIMTSYHIEIQSAMLKDLVERINKEIELNNLMRKNL